MDPESANQIIELLTQIERHLNELGVVMFIIVICQMCQCMS